MAARPGPCGDKTRDLKGAYMGMAESLAKFGLQTKNLAYRALRRRV
jgi:hypothetical protein